ncbi:unnamed protein product, partial [Effrenium voratum]
ASPRQTPAASRRSPWPRNSSGRGKASLAWRRAWPCLPAMRPRQSTKTGSCSRAAVRQSAASWKRSEKPSWTRRSSWRCWTSSPSRCGGSARRTRSSSSCRHRCTHRNSTAR